MSFDLTNKNIEDTFQNLLQKTGSDGRLYDLQGNPVIDLRISGSIIAEEYVVSSSVTHLTTQTLSGSTRFGDSTDDTHIFTGSLIISGGSGNNTSGFGIDNGQVTFGRLQAGPTPKNSITSVTFVGDDATVTFDGGNSTFDFPDNSKILFGTGFGGFGHDHEIFHNAGTSRFVIADNPAGAGSGIELRAHKNIILSGSVTASGDISSSGDLISNELYLDNASSIRNQSTNVRLRIGTPGDSSELKLLSGHLNVASNITASGNISSSGTITGNSIVGTLGTAAQTNITSLGTLTTLTVDDITINDSKISDSGNLEIETGGDLFFDTSNEIILGSTATQIRASGHITASGNISSSGTGSFANLRVTDLSVPDLKILSSSISTRLTNEEADADFTATLISGSFTAASSSFSTRVTTNETKLDTIETNADVTDTSNVTSAGALMDSELSEIATVKALTAVGISGSFTAASSSFSTRVSANEVITAKTLVSSSTQFSTSDNVTFNHITASGNISSSGTIIGSNLSGTNTGDQDLSGLALKTEVSGAFTSDSASFSTRLTTAESELNNTLISSSLQFDSSDNVTFNNITASGNISASGTVFASAFSSPDGDGDIDFSDSLDVAGNITASGDISASGDLNSNKLLLNNDLSTDYLTGTSEGVTYKSENHKFLGHITASGNISASGTLFANKIVTSQLTSSFVTSSTSILIQNITSSGDSLFGNDSADTHKFTGDITASGNISSSGDLSVEDINIQGNITHIGDSDTSINFGDDDIRIAAGGITTQFTTTTVGLGGKSLFGVGNITASGNISASGTIIGNSIRTNGSNENGLHENVQGKLTISASNDILIDTADDIIFKSEGTEIVHIKGDEAELEVNGSINTTSHITASGNISASLASTGSFGKIEVKGTGSFDGGAIFGSSISSSDHIYLNDSKRLYFRDTGESIYSVSNNNIDLVTGGAVKLRIGGDHSKHLFKLHIGSGLAVTPTQQLQVGGTIWASGSDGYISASGDIITHGHITASGNISASGDILANSYNIQGVNAVELGSGTTTLANTSNITKIQGTGIILNAPVSASGDISSSADIIGNTFNVGTTGFRIREALGGVNIPDGSGLSSTNITASGDISSSGALISTNATIDRIDRIDNAKTGVAFGDGINVINDMHITASGNISASGTLIGGGLNVVGSGAGELEVAGNITASGDISSSYTSTGSIGILELHGGVIDLKNAGAQSQIRMYCESSNAHFQTIKSAPHSDGASNTLVLPAAGSNLVSDTATQTLTNKTLTAPTINGVVSGNITASGNISASGDLQSSKLTIVKGGASSNEKLISLTGGQGSEKFSVDEDGDVVAATAIISSGEVKIGTNDSNGIGLLNTGTREFLVHQADDEDTKFLHYKNGGLDVTGHITASAGISSSGVLITSASTKVSLNKLVSYDTSTGQFHITASSAFLGSGGGGGGAVSSVTNGANNRVATFSGTDSLNGESNLTFDGNVLTTAGNISSSGGNLTVGGRNIFFSHRNTPNNPVPIISQSSQGQLSIGDNDGQDSVMDIQLTTAGGNSKINFGDETNVTTRGTGFIFTSRGGVSSSAPFYGDRGYETGSVTAVGNTTGGDIVYFGQSSGLTAGTLYYLSTGGTWAAADASDNTAGADELLGIALGSNATVNGVLLRGVVNVTGISNLTNIGRALYISTTAGDVTETAPSSNNNIVRIVGYVTNANDTMYFNPDSTWVKVTA